MGTPENHKIRLLNLEGMVLPGKQGQDLDFTSYQVPGSVVSHVDCAVWTNRLNQLEAGTTLGRKFLMMKDLTWGCDSRVEPPGVSASFSPSCYAIPAINVSKIDVEVRNGRMASLFKPGRQKSTASWQ